MSEASRAFDPREARDPHSGKWIAAGVGQAGFLHGKAVVGKHISGKDVHGVYRGGGYVAPSSGGVPVKVTHVRPDKSGSPSGPDYNRLPSSLFSPPSGEGAHVPAENIRKGHYVEIGGVTHKVLQTEKNTDHPGMVRLHLARKEDIGKRRRLQNVHGKSRLRVLGEVGRKLAQSLELGSAVEPLVRALTHEPLGKPGGPGLWGMKTEQLPAYIQHIAKDLMEERGMERSRAIATAVAQCKRWAAGGENVHPDTRAKAAAAIAEWERLRAKAHATRSTDMSEHDADGLDASWDGELDDLDLTGLRMEDLDAAAAEDEQTFGGWLAAGDAQRLAKLGSGARFAALKDKLAAKGIDNPGALAAKIGRAKFGKKRFHALAAAGRRRTAPAAAAARAGELFRTYALEDCRIMTRAEGAGSGRIVEAYAAVFDTPAEIRDHQGHYLEEIHRNAFDQAIGSAHPDRNGGMWRVAVLYNHGLTVHGSPAERFSMPAGVPVDIQAEARGLLTRTEYAQTPLGEEILELVRMGALRSQSFTGGIGRSEPGLRGPGDKYRPQGTGMLQRVRRYVLGLREYGLTPFPAYSGAEVCGVRMQLPDGYDGFDEVEPFGEIEGDEGVTEWEDDATGYSPEVEDSPASTGHRLYQLRSEDMLRQAGIELRGR